MASLTFDGQRSLRQIDEVKAHLAHLLANQASIAPRHQSSDCLSESQDRSSTVSNDDLLRRLQTLESENESLQKERDSLKTQLTPDRITVIVDGDGAIFHPDLIKLGFPGGRKAAKILTAGIQAQFPDAAHLEITALVFLNKWGLAATLTRVPGAFRDALTLALKRLDEFMVGFSEASGSFLIANAGRAKEAADVKVRAFLKGEAQSPKTRYIVLALTHDQGYATSLLSEITRGHGDKLYLLQSYEDVVTPIAELDLPTFSIPGLFLHQRIELSPGTRNSGDGESGGVSSLLSTPALSISDADDEYLEVNDTTFPPLTVPVTPMPRTPIRMSASMLGLTLGEGERSASEEDVGMAVKPLSELQLSLFSSSEDSDEGLEGWTVSGKPKKVRLQAPPSPRPPRHFSTRSRSSSSAHQGLCVFHHLQSGCSRNECKYVHGVATQDDLDKLKAMTKKTPCNLFKDGNCIWGEQCLYGHD